MTQEVNPREPFVMFTMMDVETLADSAERNPKAYAEFQAQLSQLLTRRQCMEHTMHEPNKIEADLKAKLDPKHVKSRKQGGATLSYIEGWRAIKTMNDIFGHLNWSRHTVNLREICRYTNKNGNHVVGYEAKVIIAVNLPDVSLTREGTGYGNGIAGDLFSAIESAGKEAETDAMKRAMMTLGNPLGLALYDKKQSDVGIDPKPRAPVAERLAKAKELIEAAKTEKALKKLTDSPNFKALVSELDGTEKKAELMQLATKCFQKFMNEEAEHAPA
jgi:DNA recombination protein Rad52